MVLKHGNFCILIFKYMNYKIKDKIIKYNWIKIFYSLDISKNNILKVWYFIYDHYIYYDLNKLNYIVFYLNVLIRLIPFYEKQKLIGYLWYKIFYYKKIQKISH